MIDPRDHPAEDALLAWVDEPEAADRAVGAHVAECAACRARADALAAIVAALAAGPGLPEPAVFDARRAALLDALPPRPAARPVALRRLWWAPVLAAAGLGGLLLFGPESRDRAPGTGAPLADLPAALGDSAADDVFAAATAASAADEAPALDDEAAFALATVDAAAISPLDDEALLEASIEDEFTALSEDAQGAILEELETMTFDL